MRSPVPLDPYPDNLTQRLVHWAKAAPDRIFLAQRKPDGGWRTLSYAQTLAQVRAVAQALLERDLSAEQPIAILSGNDIEHALLGLAAMQVGIPYAPISVPYSLMSSDFGKLKSIINDLTPGLVFAANGGPFAQRDRSGGAAGHRDRGDRQSARRTTQRRRSPSCWRQQPTAAVDAAHAKVGPDTIGKILFTSGSTGYPKGVINTQRMLCSNQAHDSRRARSSSPTSRRCWSTGCRGTTPSAATTISTWCSTTAARSTSTRASRCPAPSRRPSRNLKEIAPTIYFNVPKGFEMLLPHLRDDADAAPQLLQPAQGAVLRRRRLAAVRLGRIAADEHRDLRRARDLPVQHRLDRDRAAGARLQLGFSDGPGNIGLPAPGVELKLVPNRRQARSPAARDPTSRRAIGGGPTSPTRPSTTRAITRSATR